MNKNFEIDKVSYVNDASFLKYNDKNRDVREAHAISLSNKILKGEKFMADIIVDINTMSIVDGQHRKRAFELAWEKGCTTPMGILFKSYPKEKLHDIIINMNNHQKGWNTNDFVDKQKMRDFMNFCLEDNHPLLHKETKKNGKRINYRYASMLIFGRNETKAIRNNQIEVTEDMLSFARSTYSEIERIINLSPILKNNIGPWVEGLINAWRNVRTDELYKDLFDSIGSDVVFHNINKYTTNIYSRGSDWEKVFKSALIEMGNEK